MPEELNFFTFFCSFLSILFASRNPFSFYRMPGYSALQSDRTQFRFGSLSPDDMHAGGGFVIFVRQLLFFAEISAFSSSLRLTATFD